MPLSRPSAAGRLRERLSGGRGRLGVILATSLVSLMDDLLTW